jgi:hypothetical protein
MNVLRVGEERVLDKQALDAQKVASPELLDQWMFAQLTACSSEISRLSPTDANVFRNVFQQESLCYANNWLYMLRATRNDLGGLGYKFVGKDTVMGIGYRNNTLYLIHPIGCGSFNTIVDFCQQIRKRVACSIILKKIDRILYERLSSTNLFQGYIGDLTLCEEEAFPENVLLLERLYSPGIDARSLPLLRKVKRFENGSMHLLAQKDGASIEKHPGFHNLFGHSPEKYRSYLQIIREVDAHRANDGRYTVCLYIDEHAAMHGLYISEWLGAESMGLYCAVSSKSSPGITEWMDYDFFQQLFHNGVRYLYLGGSETQGVDAYIQKLLPVAPPYLMRPMEIYGL